MKFYKLILAVSVPFILSACESIPNNVQTLGTTLNNGIKSINEVLGATGSTSSTSAGQSKTASQSGMLTKEQCQNSKGKTKIQIEKMAHETLTDARADMLNSIAVTYNFQISDQVSRYGLDSRFKAICSLTFEGNQSSSKVLHWSIVG